MPHHPPTRPTGRTRRGLRDRLVARRARRLVPTLLSVGLVYAVTALAVVLVVTVVMPVAAQHPRVPALAVARMTQAAQSVGTPGPVSAALAERGEDVRPSRTMRRTVIEPRPRVARQVVIKKITWALPVSGYHLTGRFGDRSWLWSSGMHTGLDFAAPTGTTIRSIAGGVVQEAGWAGSYGYRTVVSLPGGGQAWYCHQSSVLVSVGQRVSAGQPIGAVGATGNVTGSHLHLEIRPTGEKGDPVDPYAVLVAHGIQP